MLKQNAQISETPSVTFYRSGVKLESEKEIEPFLNILNRLGVE